MRKIKLLLGLLVLTLAMISCQQESGDALITKQSTKSVTIEMDAPTIEMQLMKNARSLRSDAHTLRFVLEVWENTENEADKFVKRIEQLSIADNKATAFTFEVEEGDYKLLFWADYVDKTSTPIDGKYTELYYTTSVGSGDDYKGLKAVTLNESNFGVNNEKRDAFYGSTTLVKEAAPVQLPKQTLKRALAKLTIFEKNKLAITNTKSVTIEYNVPNTFNVATKSTTNTKFKVNLSDIVLSSSTSVETPQVIFYDYILSSVNGETMGEIKLTGKSITDVTMAAYTIPANVPLKQNARTNLLGNILEEGAPIEPGKDVNVDIEVEEGWENPDSDIEDWEGKPFEGEGTAVNPYKIGTKDNLKELAKVVNAGQAVYRGAYFELTADIELIDGDNNDKISIGNSRDNYFEGNFDGKGFSIINHNGSTNGVADVSGVFGFVKNSSIANLRVKNAKIISSADIVGGLVGVVLKGDKSTSITNCELEVLQITGNAPKEVAGKSTRGPLYIGGICALAEGDLRISASKLSAASTTGLKSNVALTKHIGAIVGSIASDVNVVIEASYNENKLIAPVSVNAADKYNVGGICGFNGGTLSITNSYNIGVIQLPNKAVVEDFSNVVLGQLLGDLDNKGATIADCYFTGKVENLIGTNNSATRFSADKWPTWTNPWGNIGAHNTDNALIVYPKLSWE